MYTAHVIPINRTNYCASCIYIEVSAWCACTLLLGPFEMSVSIIQPAVCVCACVCASARVRVHMRVYV